MLGASGISSWYQPLKMGSPSHWVWAFPLDNFSQIYLYILLEPVPHKEHSTPGWVPPTRSWASCPGPQWTTTSDMQAKSQKEIIPQDLPGRSKAKHHLQRKSTKKTYHQSISGLVEWTKQHPNTGSHKKYPWWRQTENQLMKCEGKIQDTKLTY